MPAEELVVHGAREHNLKDVTVALPRNKLICITGLSGSGKSSLAFDTIYAEGQRRYVESLSAYARQFLQMMEKPDVDSIDGLSPAISIDQKTTSRNPRSTVGTVTEIYDYLRLLYARVGRPHCPVCGRPIAGQSLESIVDQILALPGGDALHRQRAGRARPQGRVPRRARGAAARGLHAREGRRRAAAARGRDRPRQEVQAHDRGRRRPARDEAGPAHAPLAVGRDGDAARRGARRRSTSSTRARSCSSRENFACPDHGVSLPELQPRIFSFNSPHGACPRCTGLGSQQEIDPDLLVPDGSVSIADGALVPWSVGNSSFYESVISAICERYEIDPDTPWDELTEDQQNLFLYGTKRRARLRAVPQPDGPRAARTCSRSRGSSRASQRRYKETDSSQQRERIEEYMSFRPCPVCKGARLKPEVLAVTVGEQVDPRVHADVGDARARVPRRARPDRDRAADRPPHHQGDPRAADVPRQRRRRLPAARPRVGDAVGRRGAAAAARDADRLAARRRALHPRRAVDRAAPARQRPADRDARCGCATSATRCSSSSTTSR